MGQRCLDRKTELRRNCRRTSTYTRCRSVGAGMGTRVWIWVLIVRTTARGAPKPARNASEVPTNGAKTHRRHRVIKGINTNLSFHSTRRPMGPAGFGYSVSGVQFFGLTVLCAGHQPHLAGGLQAMQQGGIDRLARQFVGGGLNSNQINHLRQNASETHYRGQSTGDFGWRWCACRRCGSVAHGRGKRQRATAGQLPHAPAQGRAQDPYLPHHSQW